MFNCKLQTKFSPANSLNSRDLRASADKRAIKLVKLH